MDLNEAALKLAKIQIIKSQVEHLQNEAREGSSSVEYAKDCNDKAQELIALLNVNSLFQ